MAEVSLLELYKDECLDLTDYKSELKWFSAIRKQAITWADFVPDLPSSYGITRPQWIKIKSAPHDTSGQH